LVIKLIEESVIKCVRLIKRGDDVSEGVFPEIVLRHVLFFVIAQDFA